MGSIGGAQGVEIVRVKENSFKQIVRGTVGATILSAMIPPVLDWRRTGGAFLLFKELGQMPG